MSIHRLFLLLFTDSNDVAVKTENESHLSVQCHHYQSVRLCFPLPLFPCPYMVLPVSQSLLVQSVSAVCLDYVPGVSSYVSLYIVCSAPCYLWIIVNVMCVRLVWMSFPVFLYPVLCVPLSIKYPVCYILVSSFLDPRVNRDTITVTEPV